MVAQAITQFTMKQWRETPGYSLSGHQSFFGDKAQRMLAEDLETTTFYQTQLDVFTYSPALFQASTSGQNNAVGSTSSDQRSLLAPANCSMAGSS